MRNETLETWILLVASHTNPSRIHWCDGGEAELGALRAQLVAEGMLQPLNPSSHPGSFLHRSSCTDAVRAEQRRFVSSASRDEAGPTNQWLSEEDAYRVVWPLFGRAMKGRPLFVAPYVLGPHRSKYARVGVMLTDSPWVVLLLATLTRMGTKAIAHLGSSSDFARTLHCSGDRDLAQRFLVEFPAKQTCWSIGTGYPESASLIRSHTLGLLGALAPEEGYLAEHMSVARVTTPSGTVRHVAAGFPSGCGKTRLAMMGRSLPGWNVEMVADGMCLLRPGDDGRLWAMNPAAGIDMLVGDAHRLRDPGLRAVFGRDAIFTNVALRADGSPWWEGSGEPAGHDIVDWQGRPWKPGGEPAAHPNARFITKGRHVAQLSSSFADPYGVPLSAILFGGRRTSLVPLVVEATSWEHGVYWGATSRSETAPGAGGLPGELRNDPMAMLPFCSYNMADYFGHWLRLGQELRRPPRIFHVNWFRADAHGRLLWPGFRENVRVLDWVLNRIERAADAHHTPIGLVPRWLDTTGLDLSPSALDQLFQVDVRAWLDEAAANREFLAKFGQRLPAALWREHEALVQRLQVATN